MHIVDAIVLIYSSIMALMNLVMLFIESFTPMRPNARAVVGPESELAEQPERPEPEP